MSEINSFFSKIRLMLTVLNFFEDLRLECF